MESESVLPKLFRCPKCNSDLLEIVYGMPGEPTKACSKCDWRGAHSGRTWVTEWVQTTQTWDESAPNNSRIEKRTIDLKTMSEAELWEFAEGNLQARYELVHRGIDPFDIDENLEAKGISLPLIRKEEFFFFYNTDTRFIEQVCLFVAQGQEHDFFVVRSGMDDWDKAWTLEEFHLTVFSMKKDGIEVWCSEMPTDDITDEEWDQIPFSYGSPLVKKMLANEKLDESQMFEYAGRFQTRIFWPHWFDPGLMLSYLDSWRR